MNHPKVFEVPLGIFRLDRKPIEGQRMPIPALEG